MKRKVNPATVVLSKRQLAILAFIRAHRIERLCPPTQDEIGARFGVCNGTVRHHLAVLIDAGLLLRPAGRNRAMVETRAGADLLARMA